MSDQKIAVLKFGGSVIRSENDIPLVVHEIYRRYRRGSRILAVVSAFGGTTDALLRKAQVFGDDVHAGAVATLLSTGEATSAALLTLALERAGVPAKVLTPAQVGIVTVGDLLDGEPVEANTGKLADQLRNAVVIVSGFAGINEHGDPTLLGRGGTDYTALFLARKLDAKCVLLKDVDGLYDSNPAAVGGFRARRFQQASYQTALKLGGELIQPKAVRFAEQHGQSFEIAALVSDYETRIGNYRDIVAEQAVPNNRRVKVALLGCGTVGGGVYERLTAMCDKFEIVGVTNLDPAKALGLGIGKHLIVPDPYELIERDCDVVIELIGGIDPARELIKRALNLGRHVVTANKAVLAENGYAFDNLAEQKGVKIRYSAAVGGSMPALETAYRITSAKAIRGIINGTCNFICDELATGRDLNSAIRLAQAKGFAEADPTLDLDGTDAAQKLVLLIRASFGAEIPLSSVRKTGIEKLDKTDAQRVAAQGRSIRLVAECRKTDNGLQATVRPVEVAADHPFANTRGAENCLLIETETRGEIIVRGRGAGRYATTESVIADLFDIREALNQQTNPVVRVPQQVTQAAYQEVAA